MEATIRPARLDDAGALQRHCYPESSVGDVRDYLAWSLRQAEKGRILRLVAEVEGHAVANAQLTVWGQNGEIGSLVVAQGYRRRGLATRLLRELIDEARQRELATLEISVCDCQPAILGFYQRLGFRRTRSSHDPPIVDRDKKGGLSHPVRPGRVVQLRMLL